MSASEISLLRRFVSDNDPEAFCGIITAHKDLVFAAARRILRDAADAEDVTQECFLELARKAPNLKPPLAGWLHRLAVQRSINVVRNKTARQDREQRYAAAQELTVEQAWEHVGPRVDEALDHLAEDVRIPLVMHFLEGRPQTEIAQTLNVDQATISRRIKQGIDDLRTRLDASVPVLLLETVLLKNAIQTAPATLTATLGKLALSGVARSAAVAGARTGLFGVLVMNAKLILVALVSALAAVVLTLGVQGRIAPPAPVAPPQPISAPAMARAVPAAPAVPNAPDAPAAPAAKGAAAGNENKAAANANDPQWQVIASKYARIHYSAEFERDAHDCEKYISDAVDAMVKEFGAEDSGQLWSTVELDVYLYPKTADKARTGGSWLESRLEHSKEIASLYILTRSSPDNQGTDFMGEPHTSESYTRELFFGAASTLVFHRITGRKLAGWNYFDSPDWFHNGLPFYLSVSRATERGRTAMQEKYLNELRAHPERVSRDLHVENQFRDGDVLMRYVVDTYGVEKIKKLLRSKEATFWQAMKAELGLTTEKLYADFFLWLTGKPAPAQAKDQDF